MPDGAVRGSPPTGALAPPGPPGPAPPLPLRPYQVEALDAITGALSEGITRQLVALPTGAGKTVVFSYLIRDRAPQGRALVLVHRDELLRQAAEKLSALAPDLALGVVKAGEDQHSAPVVLASVQTLARARRLARLVADFATVVVDEAHHATGQNSYRRILEYLGAFRPPGTGPLVVGFTATPERADGAPLAEVWQRIVYRRTLLELIAPGYLVNLRGLRVQLGARGRGLDLDRVAQRGGDFRPEALGAALAACGAPETVARAYVEHAAGRPAVVYVPTVRLAGEVATALVEAGVPAAALDASTPLDLRREHLAALRSGELRAIVNVGVLTEGWDEPAVACVMIARPTRSRPLYLQMVGRGARPFPGKTDCLVLDFSGASERYSLVSLSGLFELPAAVVARDGIVAALAPRPAPAPPVSPEVPVRAAALGVRAVDLFGRRPLCWLRLEGARYVLSGPGGFLLLEPEGPGGFTRVVYYGDAPRVAVGERRIAPPGRVLAAGLSLEYGQGVAEDAAREAGWSWLIEPAARWRDRPATEGQLRRLAKLRVLGARAGREGPAAHGAPALTRGEASDLIAVAMARRRLRAERSVDQTPIGRNSTQTGGTALMRATRATRGPARAVQPWAARHG